MSASAEVQYTVSVPQPEAHIAEVEVRVSGAAGLGDEVELAMAAWSPGSYLVRDYARFVRDVTASAAGEPALVHKVGKHTWRVQTGGADDLVVRYRVYGRDLTVRTNHIDGSHAFLHGPATYLYLPALRHAPQSVVPVAPDGWRVTLALPEDGGAYRAGDVDELLDSPLHMGVVEVRDVDAGDVPVELVVWGELDPGGVGDLDRLADDLASVVAVHCDRFGSVPFDAYSFVLMLAPGAYGGLEHRACSANLSSPAAMATDKAYGDLVELLSHELFHAWNGKRIVPEGLSPLAYDREQYTRCLWVVEGLTSYYDRITARRAGVMKVARYLEKLCEEWGRLQWTPGRRRHSLEDASFDAWIKLYQAHESNVNTTVSYYLKGGLVALCLDLEIRARTACVRGLDDVLVALWTEYGAAGRPYPEDPRALFEAASGIELAEVFDGQIRGTADPDLSAALARAGLELRATHDGNNGEAGGAPPWLGVNLKSGCRVALVLDDSPAAAAGVSPGDEIVALDRRRVRSESDLKKRLRVRTADEGMVLTVFRRGYQREIAVELAPSPAQRYEIAAVAEPTDDQRAVHSAWLGGEHPASGAVIAGATVGRYL